MSAISDALSTLSDRGLRRLLGARTFLRGLDYEKRKVVEEVDVNDSTAQGKVRGSDPDPYAVTIRLGGEGITSHCTCPAFQKTGQHCKHVAALLITVRNRARAALPRPVTPPGGGGGGGGAHQHNQHHPHVAHNPHNQHAQQLGDGSKASRRRDRRRRVQTQQLPVPQAHYAPPLPDASARPTGIGAWLAPDGAVRALRLEFRVHVRQGGLTVTVLDVDNRVPLLPSVALGWQALSPSGDRAALRVLSRFESG